MDARLAIRQLGRAGSVCADVVVDDETSTTVRSAIEPVQLDAIGGVAGDEVSIGGQRAPDRSVRPGDRETDAVAAGQRARGVSADETAVYLVLCPGQDQAAAAPALNDESFDDRLESAGFQTVSTRTCVDSVEDDLQDGVVAEAIGVDRSACLAVPVNE